MFRGFRYLALLLGAIAMVAAPCAPALAAATSCTMPGCDESPYGSINTASCCCGEAGAPAQTGGQTNLAGSQLKTLASFPAHEPLAPCDTRATIASNAPAPPAHVPLFLLNASLLI